MRVSDIIFDNHQSHRITLPNGQPVHVVLGILPGNIGTFVGIDPGVNFGLTIIHDDAVMVHWGALPPNKVKGEHGKAAYSVIWGFTELAADLAIVEGAAYHSQFGQVGLEEVRNGFFLALSHLEIPVKIVPPATIRKLVFDDGKFQAGDEWPWLNHNAADSLSIAMYALLSKGEENAE